MFRYLCFFILTNITITLTGQDYRENVYLHVGRKSYIAGEHIWYKAYCSSGMPNPDVFLSKVVYVELVNNKKESVLSQIVQIKNNSASSVLSIPDTLLSGLYYLKVYTNLMKKNGEEAFHSAPVFIYNQYDKNAVFELKGLNTPLIPEIFIPGEKLIADAPAEILVRIPILFESTISGILVEKSTQHIIENFTFDRCGIARIQFTPGAGSRYYLQVGDSLIKSENIELPLPVNFGFNVSAESYSNGILNIKIVARSGKSENTRLIVKHENEVVSEVPVPANQTETIVQGNLPENLTGIVNLELISNQGVLLAEQYVLIESEDNVTFKNRNDKYVPGEKIEVDLNVKGIPINENALLSVSVHHPADQKLQFTSSDRIFGNVAFRNLGKGAWSIFPKYLMSDVNSTYGNDFLIENLGILCFGKLEIQENTIPLSEFTLILAVKDTLGEVVGTRSDDNGNFVILLNEFGQKEALVKLMINDMPYSGAYTVSFSNNFYYQGKTHENSTLLYQVAGDSFATNIQDEALRVLIQKAFGNNNGIPVLSDSVSIDNRFYTEPELTVYPGNYIFLPNFEEISREILPRVRYEHTKNSCQLYINQFENNIRSSQPIVFIDGRLVTDFSELYPLNSDDIQRIEIQSGLRSSGNLVYNGLLAIYTTPKFKKDKKKNIRKTNYSITGYSNNASTFCISDSISEIGKKPDFKNQLYWNPNLVLDENGHATFEFFTSDEEGVYEIEITGLSEEGIPLHIKKLFYVEDKN